MEAVRNALIIATDDYADPKLRRLRAPVRDAEELARVLADPSIGEFDVEVLLNESEPSVRRKLAQFFANRNRDDLLLVHFSCHGLKDDDGNLYFATPDTEVDHLDATAVPSDFVNRQMQRSRSRRIALFLDCCYSGAFSRGALARAGDGVQLAERFDGQGQVVITASNSMEYAFEGDELTGAGTPSVFTTALVEGLETGAADRDGDDLVSIDELYDYVYDRVREHTPGMTPSKWTYDLQGELYVARNPKPRPVTPAELPGELREALQSPLTSVRLGIVDELERMVAGSNVRLATAARLALQDLGDDDSRAVSAAAAEALERADATRASGEAEPEVPAPYIARGSVRSSPTFATRAPAAAARRFEPDAGRPSAEVSAADPSWWPFSRVSPRLVVLGLGFLGAALLLATIRFAKDPFAGQTYVLGVAAASALATSLAGLRRPIAASGAGALISIGLLSLAGDATLQNPDVRTGESSTMAAAALFLLAGLIGVAAIANLRAEDRTPPVRRGPARLLAPLLASAGAGLWVAALVLPVGGGFTLRETYYTDGALRLGIVAIVLGLAGLTFPRVGGGTRLVLAGVLAGAGVQTVLYFAGLRLGLRDFGESVQAGTYLGLAAGLALVISACVAYLRREEVETSGSAEDGVPAGALR